MIHSINPNSYTDNGSSFTKHIPLSYAGQNGQINITIRKQPKFLNRKVKGEISLSNVFEYQDDYLRDQMYKKAIDVLEGREVWSVSGDGKNTSDFVFSDFCVKVNFNGNEVKVNILECKNIEDIKRRVEEELNNINYRNTGEKALGYRGF